MSTHLVETGADEFGLVVARHVATQLDGGSEGSALAQTPGSELLKAATECRSDAKAFAATLVPHTALILDKSEPADTEACLNMLCHLVAAVTPASESLSLALQMCDALCADSGRRNLVRVATMLQLFNTASAPETKISVLMRVLNFARAHDAAALAPSLHKQAELWDREWQLSSTQRGDLFAAVADVLDTHPNTILKAEALGLRSRVLLTAQPGDAAALADVAYKAALVYLAAPGHFACDMFASPAVQALKGHKEYGQAYALLDTMVRGDIAAYKQGNFGAVLDAAKVTPEAAMEKMRMMALMALCHRREGDAVPFADVIDALALEGDDCSGDAEAWLVRAFGKLLVDGKIDQVSGTVFVRRCENRVYGDEQWQRLRGDLQTWQENLKGIEVMLKDSTLLTPTSTVQRWLSS